MSLDKAFKATALSSAVFLSACGDSETNISSSDGTPSLPPVQSTSILEGDLASRLPDGIHHVTIPAAISGEAEDKIHVFIKDRDIYWGTSYLINIATFSPPEENYEPASAIQINTVERGNFIVPLNDGLQNLEISGHIFPDGQARRASIIKDYIARGTGYAVVLDTDVINNQTAQLDPVQP